MNEHLLEAQSAAATVTRSEDLKVLKDRFLGDSGIVKRLLSELKSLSDADKKERGPKIQEFKRELEALFDATELRLRATASEEVVKAEAEHLSALTPKIGHLHPISQTIRDMNAFFSRMGFSVYDGPEIETDEYNFQRLNVPKDHPARDMQDTFYIDAPNILLRTQTSSIEARALANLKPPFRVVCPGRVYRNEKPNKSNHFIFHHYQGVVVQEKTSLAELFGVLEMLFKYMYGEQVMVRFRSKYYPEVEPGVGPDMRCFSCEGKGCAVCKHVGWIEMGGAGIVHEHLLRAAGIDPKKYMGFAFGLGLDRWVMAKYHVEDIRAFLGGDIAYAYVEREKMPFLANKI
ncbi:MAG: phenylalanine--tRNA ligase subunit alpha [Candidatus Doudnabacteria bacterium]|nr:phenylalanine--tRNA ligase subunit alpha [Candidatus Doudnabacteria bacterium]